MISLSSEKDVGLLEKNNADSRSPSEKDKEKEEVIKK